LPPGPPGAGWQFGHGGGGSNGEALTSPTPTVSADMPTPVAIVAALTMRFTYIVGSSPPNLDVHLGCDAIVFRIVTTTPNCMQAEQLRPDTGHGVAPVSAWGTVVTWPC
jgi:hypothetical protein